MNEPGVGAVAAAFVFVELCDARHILVRQSEIKDIEIVTNVIRLREQSSGCFFRPFVVRIGSGGEQLMPGSAAASR